MKAIIPLLSCYLSTLSCALGQSEIYNNPRGKAEHDPDFWRSNSIEELTQRLQLKMNTNQAKNIIFFLGDGMGVSTVTAGRIYKGQKKRNSGEESVLAIDTFPFTSLAKTYSANTQTTDSAASSTAYLCGVKTNNHGIGVTANVKSSDCDGASDRNNQVDSILAWAQKEGKWTGIVTNDEIVGASPAGGYAHVSKRSFYNSVSKGCKTKDIARQLVEDKPGSKLRVIMGGGRKHFLPNEIAPQDEWRTKSSSKAVRGPGDRTDGRNLVEDWLDKHSKNNRTASYIWNKSQLYRLHEGDYPGDYFFGLFAEGKLKFSMENIFDRQDKHKNSVEDEQPTLEEMTIAAINILQKSPSGYILFVECHNIDTAHHGNLAGYALEELYQLDKAILAAHKMTSLDDTLTIVTADHSHAFTLNGYSARGTDILGASNSLPYSILSYAAGPGASAEEETDSRHRSLYTHKAMVYLRSGVHGGEDVAVYAKGPWAHLFTGSHENTYIPIALAYAACINHKGPHCNTKKPSSRLVVLETSVDNRNQTLIDHINGRTIAPDVLKPSRRVVRKVLRRSNPFEPSSPSGRDHES
ncbi:alkaline phosphatase [Galendromus occidentalis]|uniref:alkaline phosphatase n=1 Tax=Galendromus occidentalis TaxID=34638 RepID=A0AAJ7SGE1_9ACAR|nr:alkaline phosphatase [Galendromus occidentalis]